MSITIDEVEQALQRWHVFNQSLDGFALNKPVAILTQLHLQIIEARRGGIALSELNGRQKAALRGPTFNRIT